MGRHKDAARYRELLDGCTAYAEEHGLFGLTLRPLAEDLGTSTRNLLHHFGSREVLIDAVVDRVRASYLDMSRELISRIRCLAAESEQRSGPEAVADVIAEGLNLAWAEASAPSGRRRIALFFEIYSAAARDPGLCESFLRPAVDEWLTPMADAIERAGAPPRAARSIAARIVAVHRGLLLEYLALGPNAATQSAHDDAVVAARAEILAGTPPTVPGSAAEAN
ncbi:TetR family transcriptional regulator [Rhodococcus oxybenzonivorans]|uniref:TetR family transcriptional regulator n=1 Tax=Rhodococcus oxybenzonivorans TaxID=1990687 RepID=A0A2S2BVC3_9NOCA|nr:MULTISPECIES: TetR/AcrR family transcriptional regulator [Rhodococcus]AWK72509.1 TetR family transcriptional regulator [Rhodococcus oxybenzonivorans]QTJ64412.1 TetR/AcrR family transcriptional regulator [Rhodococcus sp. ZPP]